MESNRDPHAKKEIKLWGGRFSCGLNPQMESFNSSISFDQRLWNEDIKGSIAYAQALGKCQLISAGEEKSILTGLSNVRDEWANGTFQVKGDEDIHSANERRLKELIGSDVGGKLPTGRSRNDQVATDVRLWLREEISRIKALLVALVKVCWERAKKETDILMPGYTHMQRAQPIRWSHWLLSYAWYFHNDANKLDSILASTNVLPLGSGALAGNPFDISREFLAKELGFSGCIPNSILAVADRDFIAEFIFWCSLTAVHLSRLAEDLILYSTKEFAFVTIDDAYSTGSSLMPQKKNADGLELIRGKSGRIIGHCVTMLVVLKGIPSAFNKDLQEDKEPLFDACDTMEGLLQIACGTLDTLVVHKEACLAALSPDMLATDVAYYLVKKGVAFREGHRIAGELVALAESEKCQLSELTLKQLKQISVYFDEDISLVWDYEHSVEQYQVFGGTSQRSVNMQLEQLEQWLANSQTLIS